VTVYWNTGAAGDPGNWDTHDRNAERLQSVLLPPFDLALTALLEDLHQRGLLDETLVVWCGEFGRTPKINKSGGRDHWGFLPVGAAGRRRRCAAGQVYGSSDAWAALPGGAAGDARRPGRDGVPLPWACPSTQSCATPRGGRCRCVPGSRCWGCWAKGGQGRFCPTPAGLPGR